MVGFTGIKAVYLYPGLIDMRKGQKSLGSIVSEMTSAEQRRNSAFVFFGTSRKSPKIVLFDNKGSWMFQRKLTDYIFRVPEMEGGKLKIEHEALETIIDELTKITRCNK